MLLPCEGLGTCRHSRRQYAMVPRAGAPQCVPPHMHRCWPLRAAGRASLQLSFPRPPHAPRAGQPGPSVGPRTDAGRCVLPAELEQAVEDGAIVLDAPLQVAVPLGFLQILGGGHEARHQACWEWAEAASGGNPTWLAAGWGAAMRPGIRHVKNGRQQQPQTPSNSHARWVAQ